MDYYASFFSTPGRMLGLFFLVAAAVLFYLTEKKKTNERRARREARLAKENQEKNDGNHKAAD